MPSREFVAQFATLVFKLMVFIADHQNSFSILIIHQAMFEHIAHFVATKQSLQEAYVHPADVCCPILRFPDNRGHLVSLISLFSFLVQLYTSACVLKSNL